MGTIKSNNPKDYKVQSILEIIDKEKPRTVKQLIQLAVQRTGLSREQVFTIIRQLEKEGMLRLKSVKKIPPIPNSLQEYLFQNNFYAIEFWSIIAFSVVFIATTKIPNTSNLFFIRVITSFIYTLFVPGWVLTNIFFPRLYETIDLFERILLSMGLSLGINLLLGFALNAMFEITTFSLSVSTFTTSLVLLIFGVVMRLFVAGNKMGLKKIQYKTKKNEEEL